MTRRHLGTAAATLREWTDLAEYQLRLPRVRRVTGRPGRRILIVTRGLPPRFHGGSLRQVSLLRALADAGWEIDAVTDSRITAPTAAGLRVEERLPDTLRMHRWASPSAASWKLAPRLSGGFSTVRQILDATPDLSPPPAVVLASGPPFAEFVAAALLARRYRAPCVLDYRDEWSTSTFAFVGSGRHDVRWERRCLAAAAAVVFTTGTMRSHYQATFPELRGARLSAIRNGWDDTGAFPGTAPATEPDLSRPAAIGFFGFLGEHWDFPEFARTLAAALAMEPDLANRIRFCFFGTVSADNAAVIAALGQPSAFTLGGLVPHDEAQRRMAECDALLLFNSERLARVIPGKTFEYIACRRPVLLYGGGGEMESLLAGLPGTLVVQRGDSAGLLAALRQVRSGEPAAKMAAAAPDYLQEFRRTHRDREWLDLLDQLVAVPSRAPSGGFLPNRQ